jgi:hypothetical protein
MRQQQQQQMSLTRQRLLTLVYGDMETVRMVCTFFSFSVTAWLMHCIQASKHLCGTVPPIVSPILSFNV